MPRRVSAPGLSLLSALPEELILRILSVLPVEVLERTCVNRKFRRLFHEPLLWKTKVQPLLRLCTSQAQLAVHSMLLREQHLWSDRLQYDHEWRSRVTRFTDSEALALQTYGRAGNYKKAYQMISQMEMVSVRKNASGVCKLATIPFTQTIRNVATGENVKIFTVNLVTENYFVALCECRRGLYKVLVNDKVVRSCCLVRPGDVLKMIRKNSGKIREFSILLGLESEIVE